MQCYRSVPGTVKTSVLLLGPVYVNSSLKASCRLWCVSCVLVLEELKNVRINTCL